MLCYVLICWRCHWQMLVVVSSSFVSSILHYLLPAAFCSSFNSSEIWCPARGQGQSADCWTENQMWIIKIIFGFSYIDFSSHSLLIQHSQHSNISSRPLKVYFDWKDTNHFSINVGLFLIKFILCYCSSLFHLNQHHHWQCCFIIVCSGKAHCLYQ